MKLIGAQPVSSQPTKQLSPSLNCELHKLVLYNIILYPQSHQEIEESESVNRFISPICPLHRLSPLVFRGLFSGSRVFPPKIIKRILRIYLRVRVWHEKGNGRVSEARAAHCSAGGTWKKQWKLYQ